MLRSLVVVAILSPSVVVRAEVPRCSDVPADVAYVATDLSEHSGDTGWFPSGYAAQLRLTGRVTGKTTVAMGLEPTACWKDGMKLATPGRAGAGMLDAEYGAELHLYGQIHTSVLGIQIDWTGELPLPGVPSDLLLATTATFDPIAQATASDTTSPIVLLSTNLLSSIIDISGISGGLDLRVQGAMTTTYTTTAVTAGDARITAAGASASIAAPAQGFGTTLALPLAATGTVHYAPALVFSVAFDVKILGVRVVNYQLASVTMPLPAIDRAVTLTQQQPMAIPLPHFAQLPESLGFATGAAQPLHLKNDGAAPLVVEIADAPAGVSAQGLTIAPGADGTLTVTAADPAMLGAPLVLATNDPNHPTLSVVLDPSQSGQSDDGMGGGEHSGCSATGGTIGLPLALVLALLRRRRRTIC